MHPISRICALVDSFDAMTAFRPFKQRTMTPDQAMDILRKETPLKYDPKVMDAWERLLGRTDQENVGPHCVLPRTSGASAPSNRDKRRHQRKIFHCPGRAHVLERAGERLVERPALPMEAHNISQSGLGFLCQIPLVPGTHLRIFLSAKGWEQRPLEGLTVRCRAYSDCWHEVGMQFANVQAEETAASTAPAMTA